MVWIAIHLVQTTIEFMASSNPLGPLLGSLPGPLKNKYFIVLVVFFFLMIFVDKHDLFTQNKIEKFGRSVGAWQSLFWKGNWTGKGRSFENRNKQRRICPWKISYAQVQWGRICNWKRRLTMKNEKWRTTLIFAILHFSFFIFH